MPWPGPLEALRRFLFHKRTLFAIKVVVMVSLTAWIVSIIRKDNLLDVVRRASVGYILVAGLSMAVEWWVHAWKHRMILARAGSPVPLGKLLWLNLRIFAISLFLPGEVLGGGARLVLMRNYLTVEQCLFLMITDRYTQMAVTLLFGALACLAVPGNLGLLAVFLLGTAALAAAPSLFFREGVSAWVRRRLPEAWGRKLGDTLSALRGRLSFSPGNLGVLATSAFLQAQKAVFLWLLCLALDIRVGIGVVVLYLSVIILAQHIAISFGGLGVREVTSVGFLGLYGVEPEKALVLSLLIYFLHLVKALLGGLVGLVGGGDPAGGAAGIRSAGSPAAPGRT